MDRKDLSYRCRVTKIQRQTQYKHMDPKLWKKISDMGLNDREDEFPMTKGEDGGRNLQGSKWDGLH